MLSLSKAIILILGNFNNSLLRVLEKYDDIMNIILPTLREARKKTYCPFLPICPETGKVLEVPLIEKNENVYISVYWFICSV